jgi:hypothetical protein
VRQSPSAHHHHFQDKQTKLISSTQQIQIASANQQRPMQCGAGALQLFYFHRLPGSPGTTPSYKPITNHSVFTHKELMEESSTVVTNKK